MNEPRRFATPAEQLSKPTPATGPRHNLHELIPALGEVGPQPPDADPGIQLGRETP